MTFTEYAKQVPWRRGKDAGVIVCDVVQGIDKAPYSCADDDDHGYGGFCVAESITGNLRDHIIKLHNATVWLQEMTRLRGILQAILGAMPEPPNDDDELRQIWSHAQQAASGDWFNPYV